MQTDLTAAAKRYSTDSYSGDFAGIRQRDYDETALATAYALELDDTPLTVDAIAAICGPPDYTGVRVARWSLPGETRPELRFMHELGKTVLTTYDADASDYQCRTLGQLRTAMRLSGIEVKHG